MACEGAWHISALVKTVSTYAPVWKPFENLRETVLRYRMRPVPVVFLRFAFSLHSSILVISMLSLVIEVEGSYISSLSQQGTRSLSRCSSERAMIVDRI